MANLHWRICSWPPLLQWAKLSYTHSGHPGQSGAGCEKPTKRYLHETRNTCFIFDICSFLNSLCLLGLKLFSVPLHLIPRLPLRCSETSSAGVWCCLLPCSWCSRSLWSSRCSERGKNEAKTQAEKQSKGRGVTGGMRTGHCRGVTASLWKT